MRTSLQIVEGLIYKLETNLGKAHRYAPAPQPEPLPSSEIEEVKEVIEETKPQEPIPTSSFDLWSKVDIRVGRLVEVWRHPESTKLYCERIDIGEPAPREIASGLQGKVPIEDMTGLVFVMANLKARSLGGFNSNGMVLCASKDNTTVLLRPPEGSQVGEKLALESEELQGAPRLLPNQNPKHKILEKFLPFFITDKQGFATFSGKKLKTSGGLVSSTLAEAHIS